MPATSSIPRVNAPPLIGHAWHMGTDAPAFLTRAHQQSGAVFGIQAFTNRWVVLAGREANLFASKEGAPFFSSKDCWRGLNQAYGTRETLISRDGPTHRRMRKIQTRGYARSRMVGKLPALLAMSRRELQKHEGRAISVHKLMQRLVSLQLGFLTMGIERLDRLEDICSFLRTTLACTVTQQRPRFLLKTARYRQTRARCLKFAQELLDNVNPKDDHLLADILTTHAKDPEFLPQTELVSCALAPFAAGLDTAASTLAFAAYHLSNNPDLLSDVRRDADHHFANDPGVEGLAKSKSAYGTILETLRINPIAPALSRVAASDFEFQGFEITKGTPILLATTVTHHDEQYFPDPTRFDISRYHTPRGEHHQAGAYVPFGVGPHLCLGAGMAQALMLLNLKILAADYLLEFSGTRNGLKLHRVPTLRPAPSFKVTLRPRKALNTNLLTKQAFAEIG